MENNKTGKETEKIQNLSNAETKLELIEYFDKHIRDIRNLEDNLKRDFDHKVEKYKNELDKTIKWYITIFGRIVIFIGIAGFVGLLTWSKSQIRSFRDQTKTNLQSDISTFKAQIKESLNKEVDSIRGTILSRLDQEFKTGNITGLIEDKAKEYTAKKSKKYISNKFKGAMISFRKRMNDSILSVANAVKAYNTLLINEKITPKIEESDNKLKAVDRQLTDASKINEELKDFSNFALTFVKAQSDDSEAYEQLGRWSIDKSYPFHELSSNMYDAIRRTYLERINPAFPNIAWSAGVDPKIFTCDQFKNYFKELPQKFHANLVHLIWKSKTLIDKEKMELLLDVIDPETKTSNSLNAKYFAGNILAEKMVINWQPFDYKPIQNKWQEIKDTIPAK